MNSPRSAICPCWEKLSRYRHPKFTDNMMNGGEYLTQREFTARHVVRQLGLGEDAFPLTVSLYVKTDPCSASRHARSPIP